MVIVQYISLVNITRRSIGGRKLLMLLDMIMYGLTVHVFQQIGLLCKHALYMMHNKVTQSPATNVSDWWTLKARYRVEYIGIGAPFSNPVDGVPTHLQCWTIRSRLNKLMKRREWTSMALIC